MKKAIIFGLLALALVGVGVYAIGSNTQKLTFISGTEYMQNETGQTIVRVTNSLGVPITATGCNVTIYYPNKTIWVNAVAMTQGGTAGSWYNGWTSPMISGNYEEYTQCGVAPNKILGAGSSFHVSDALTYLYNDTTNPSARIIS